MQEEVTIQTADEVNRIDYMRTTNDMIAEQANDIQTNMDIISEQLNTIIDNTTSISPSTTTNTDLSTVTSLMEDINTTTVEANTQDILAKISKQQKQIDDINDKLVLILSKL